MNEDQARKQIVDFGKSIFDRQLTGGSTGNISIRLEDRVLMTPTGSSMGTLDGDQLSVMDTSGAHLDGDRPTNRKRQRRISGFGVQAAPEIEVLCRRE